MTQQRSVPFGLPSITEEEKQAVLEVLSGPILAHGPRNKAFEEAFAAFIGPEAHCVAVSSGMAALHLSYLQLGIGQGDEVLVPAQTHIATVHAVEAVGARPVFLDATPDTGNIDLDKLEALITPRTKAIALVHFLGIPCTMDRLVAIASKHGLHIIEDCALAIGSRFKGKHAGLWGTCGCFSFYPVKHITTGEGGMFVTTDADLAAKVHKTRGFGVDRNFKERTIPGYYDVPSHGLNYRMSDINAAIGCVQLRRVPEFLAARRRNFATLKQRLSKHPDLHILDSQDPQAENSHYCLSVVLPPQAAQRRLDLIAQVNAAGVGTSIYYPQPTARMSYYRQKYATDPATYPEATRISDASVALPVGPHLNEDDMHYIADTFLKTLQSL